MATTTMALSSLAFAGKAVKNLPSFGEARVTMRKTAAKAKQVSSSSPWLMCHGSTWCTSWLAAPDTLSLSRKVLRCLPECDSGEPPLLAALEVSEGKVTEPVGRDRGGTAPCDASWGFAFAAVAGVLILQASQQALAGTQFMGLQPPADVLGDLGDISTGDGEKMNEEQEEAELAVSKFSGNGAGIMSAVSTVASTFVLVFVAEWGDKSFFSTIALAAASSPPGVIAGSLAGHGVATLIAVLGGSLLGTFLSEKIIAYIGGSLFLAFAAVTVIEIASS